MFVAIVGSALLAGAHGTTQCPGDNPPVRVAQQKTEELWQKSYSVGAPMSVVVGETVLRRKQFVRHTSITPAFCLLNGIDLKAGFGRRFQVAGGTVLVVREYRTIGGVSYSLAQWGSGSGILIDENLNVFPKIANPTQIGWVVMVPTPKYFSAPPTVDRTSIISTTESPGKENIELVYNGTDGQSLRFQYREYTSDDMARPAFSQDLTYPAKAKTIRFKSFSMKITKVSDDALEFTIEDDGAVVAQRSD